MGEMYDFNAFKKKKEMARDNEGGIKKEGEKTQDEIYLEHFRKTRKRVNLPPSIVDIDPERLEDIFAIINRYSLIRNEKTIEDAKHVLRGWVTGEIVDFLKNSNILTLKAKPAFTTAALEVLESKELGKE